MFQGATTLKPSLLLKDAHSTMLRIYVSQKQLRQGMADMGSDLNRASHFA